MHCVTAIHNDYIAINVKIDYLETNEQRSVPINHSKQIEGATSVFSFLYICYIHLLVLI